MTFPLPPSGLTLALASCLAACLPAPRPGPARLTPEQARRILADPAGVAGDPALSDLARQVALSELGPDVTLLRLEGRPTAAPHLRIVDGGQG